METIKHEAIDEVIEDGCLRLLYEFEITCGLCQTTETGIIEADEPMDVIRHLKKNYWVRSPDNSWICPTCSFLKKL